MIQKNDCVVLLSILGIAVIFQSYLYCCPEEDSSLGISDMIVVSAPLSVFIMAIFVRRAYRGSSVFGKGFLSLAIGFLFMFLAELTYLIYEFALDLEPYPSIADVLFFAFHPFVIYYLLKNTLQVKSKTLHVMIGVVAGVILITTSYTTMSLEYYDELDFDFWYGIIFVSTTSISFLLAVFASILFRNGRMGNISIIIALGLTLNMIGDIWYYYLELSDLYEYTHPVNMLWVTSFMVITYGLYRHYKSF